MSRMFVDSIASVDYRTTQPIGEKPRRSTSAMANDDEMLDFKISARLNEILDFAMDACVG